MKINFEQLNAFLIVAPFGGVRRASDLMSLSQPAVTARIKNLEAILGAVLLAADHGAAGHAHRGRARV